MDNERVNEFEVAEIDFAVIIRAIVIRAKMIGIFALTFAIASFMIYQFAVTRKYQASISMCVSNSNTINTGILDINDVNAGIALVPTFVELIQSRNIVGEVAARANDLGYDMDSILNMVSIEEGEGTQVIYVYITNPNPEHANIIANIFAEIIPDRITELMEGTSVKIVDDAAVSADPVYPNVPKKTLTGFAIGAILGIALAIILELSDKSIKSESDVKYLFPNIPIIGQVPSFDIMPEASSIYEYK